MINGMLVIRKEKGYTSSDVVARLRGILHMKKIGHTGTLDPDAEGVLPVCLGNGTRLVDLIADREKEYRCVMRLGVRTDTQDLTAEAVVLERKEEEALQLKEEDIREAAASFEGDSLQLPPMYSAVWVNGRRLYDYARKGQTVDRPMRKIHVSEIRVEEISLPDVVFTVRCSKGTYVRTLCEDMGAKLGTGGVMASLLRTRVGMFTLDMARTLDELAEMQKEDETEQGVTGRDPGFRPVRVSSLVIPTDAFFADAPKASVSEKDDIRLRNGNSFRGRDLGVPDGVERLRLYDSKGVFCGLYTFREGQYRPEKMFL